MKKEILTLLSFSAMFFLVKPVLANEGVFNLRPVDTSESGACFATSVFVDGSYRVLMTCRDLKMAVDPEMNKYVAWTETGTKRKRIGEVINGKFQGRSDDKFDRLVVTLEKDATTNKTDGKVILSGSVQPINFGTSTSNSVVVQPTISQTKVSVTPTIVKESETNTANAASGLGNFLGTVVKIALFGFGLLILVVGVFGFMSRRKKL